MTEPTPPDDRSPLLNHHAFPLNARRDSMFLEDFTDANNTLDHGRTLDILYRLGYPEPTAAEQADAAALRQDTLRRQADPATRQYLDEALRRLRRSPGERH